MLRRLRRGKDNDRGGSPQLWGIGVVDDDSDWGEDIFSEKLRERFKEFDGGNK